MTEPDEVMEMLDRFERAMKSDEAPDSENVIIKFRHWQDREVTAKQKTLLRKYARERGIKVVYPRKRRTPEERERIRRRYTTHKVRGKTKIVARIPKGKKGAGRFAKRK